MQIVWKNYAAHLLEVIRIWFFFFAFQLVLLSCVLKSDFLRYNCGISFFLKSDFLRYNCGIYQGQHNWTTSKTSIALIRNKTLEQHISVKTKKIYVRINPWYKTCVSWCWLLWQRRKCGTVFARNNQCNQCVPQSQLFTTFRTQIGANWAQFLKLPQTGEKSQTYFTTSVSFSFWFAGSFVILW